MWPGQLWFSTAKAVEPLLPLKLCRSFSQHLPTAQYLQTSRRCVGRSVLAAFPCRLLFLTGPISQMLWRWALGLGKPKVVDHHNLLRKQGPCCTWGHDGGVGNFPVSFAVTYFQNIRSNGKNCPHLMVKKKKIRVREVRKCDSLVSKQPVCWPVSTDTLLAFQLDMLPSPNAVGLWQEFSLALQSHIPGLKLLHP